MGLIGLRLFQCGMAPLVRAPELLLPVAWLSPTVLPDIFLVFYLFSGRKKKNKTEKKEKTSFEPLLFLLEATEAKSQEIHETSHH